MKHRRWSAADRRAGWRRWAREYATAVMLTAGLVAAVPDGRVAHPVAIVRMRDRRYEDRFDPRERLDARLVLTVPATARCDWPESAPQTGFDLN